MAAPAGSYAASALAKPPKAKSTGPSKLSRFTKTGAASVLVQGASERFIIVGGVIILAVGITNAWVNNKPIGKVALGGIGVVLILSLLSAFGVAATALANGLMVLAVVAVLMVELPGLLSKLGIA